MLYLKGKVNNGDGTRKVADKKAPTNFAHSTENHELNALLTNGDLHRGAFLAVGLKIVGLWRQGERAFMFMIGYL